MKIKTIKGKKIYYIIDLIGYLLFDSIGLIFSGFLYLSCGLDFIDKLGSDVILIGDVYNHPDLGQYAVFTFILSCWLLSWCIVEIPFAIFKFSKRWKRLKEDSKHE